MKLWIRLFIACGALSLATLAGFAAWQQATFARGFQDYLAAQSAQRMATVAQRLSARYAAEGGWDRLRADPMAMGAMVDLRAPNTGPRPPAPRGADGPRGPRAGPPGDALFDPGSRIALFDAEGRHVAGTRDAPATGSGVPVVVDGATVGVLRAATTPVPGDLEARFAAQQARQALYAGVVVLLLSLGVAYALARSLLGPVQALADGTRALAAGDYARRVAPAGRDELSALATDFNRLADTLQRHREARQRWGADIAHELRTPLAVQRVELQTLVDGVRPVTLASLESLLQECEHLSALADDLYQLALADSGSLAYRFETLDLVDVAGDADLRHQAALASAGLTLETRLAEQALPVRADRIRLAQLLDNLLTNARRYTDPPGRIALRATLEDGRAVLLVDDSPPAPAVADPAALFERGMRGERSGEHGGAGLGLAIAASIVVAHEGRISAAHSPLGGLRVRVELPLLAPGT